MTLHQFADKLETSGGSILTSYCRLAAARIPDLTASATMADKLPKILLLGSTGAAGKAIASALIENTQSFETIAFFTSPESANTKKDIFDGYRDKGIKVIASDLEDDNYISGLFKEYDVIVSALGRNALQLQSRLVDLIAALPPLSSGRPRRLYPSEYGTDIRYDPKTSPHGKMLRFRRQEDR